jgi:hypothetical protein
MPNVNRPFGVMPVESLGDTKGATLHRYYIASANASAFFVGDPVVLTNTGDARGVPGVAKYAAAGVPVGVLVSVEPANINGISQVGTTLDTSQVSIPATKTRDYYVYVSDDPAQIYEVQCGSVATNLVVTKLNNNFDLTVAAPSPATLPQSATIVDNSTIATTNTLPWRMLGLVQKENNEVGAYQVVRCKINTHAYGNAIAGV